MRYLYLYRRHEAGKAQRGAICHVITWDGGRSEARREVTRTTGGKVAGRPVIFVVPPRRDWK